MWQVLRSRRLEGRLFDFSPGRQSQYQIYAKRTKEVLGSKVRKEETDKGINYKTFGNPFFLDVKSVYHANERIP